MKRLRIGFDGRYIHDRYHGIGRYSFNLLEALTRLQPEKHFVVFRGKDGDTRFDWDKLSGRTNVEFTPGPKNMYYPIEQLEWLRILKRSCIDVFHSPSFIAPLLADPHMPVIVTVHDLIFDRNPKDMPNSWAYPYYRLMMKRSLSRAKQIIAVSKSTARDLHQYYRLSSEKLLLAPEGVDAVFRVPRSPDELSSTLHEYQIRSPFILAVGAHRPHKNFNRLVEAFSRLPPEVIHQLVIVGSPDPRFRNDAPALAIARNLDGRARFIDWVKEDDLPAIYKSADMVVLPSIIEGFGLPALEAMASGTLVLAANNSSFPEILADTGILFNPFDVDQITQAIQFALEKPERIKQLREAGLIRSHEFTWDRTAEIIYPLYDELLS